MDTAATRAEDTVEFQFRLFVSGATPRSTRAISAVRKLCEISLAGRASLVVVDIYREPQEARKYQIVALPTLLKLSPAPKRLFIGDMSDIRPLSAELGLIE